MDLTLDRIIIMVLAQGALAILLFVGFARRRRREKTIAAESGAAPVAETFAWSPQSWLWPVGIIVLFAVVSLLWRPVSTWYWSRHPPAIEHRSKLLEAASKQLHCPAEQLTIEPYGDQGAKVTGCAGNTILCWGRTNRSVPPAWLGCHLLY